MSQEYLDEICGIAAANGMSVATHAIGDKAAEMILEAYEKNMTDSMADNIIFFMIDVSSLKLWALK